MKYNLKFKVNAPSGDYTMIKPFETESINMARVEGLEMEKELTTEYNVFEFIGAEEQKYNLEAFEEMNRVLLDAASVLDLAILQTPTGLERERFTELNIKVLSALNKTKL